MPGSVKAVRLLLFIAAGLYCLIFVVGLSMGGVGGTVVAYLVWVCWPGIVALVFGLRVARGGRVLMWSIAALEVVRILMSVGSLASGDVAGFTQLILPVLTLVFVLREPSRRYFGERPQRVVS